MHLRDNPTDEEILAFVDGWIDDLTRGDYSAAYARTAHDPYYDWSPALIRSVIEGYGLPEPHPSGTTFSVTPRHLARGGTPERSVRRDSLRPAVIAEVGTTCRSTGSGLTSQRPFASSVTATPRASSSRRSMCSERPMSPNQALQRTRSGVTGAASCRP
jgi:hypothetical protein